MLKTTLFCGVIAVLAFGLVAGGAQTKAPAPKVEFSLEKVVFQIGDTRIHAQMRQFGENKLTMVNVHDDEQESVDAAVKVLEKQGGRLIELMHSGKRRIVYTVNGNQYSIDPNRIFSEA